MKLLNPLCLLLVLYLLTGGLLYAVGNFIPALHTDAQALGITVIASALFLHTTFSLFLLHHLAEQGGKTLTAFYLIEKVTRLLLCAILLVLYGVLVKTGILAFAMDLLALYVVTAGFTTYYSLRMEHNIKHSKA